MTEGSTEAADVPDGSETLDGRIALVTGATSGLGSVAASALAAAGVRVIVVSRTPERAEAARAVVGGDTAAVVGDVAVRGGAREIVTAARAIHGRIDVLINAAGVMHRGPIESTTDDAFYDIIDTNVFGTWAMCREVVSAMRPHGGSIINLSSAAGMVGYDTRAAYGASKGAVVQLTRCLAVELARDGIRVNAVAPGPFRSGMSEHRGATPQVQGLLAHRVPMARMAEPREISGVFTFLAGPSSSFITGVTLPVDGGWTAA